MNDRRIDKDTNVPSTDCISRQAAIDLLKQMRKDGDMVPWEGKNVFARIRELPSAQLAKDTNVPINDCIDRQAAIDAECEVCQIAPKKGRGHNCTYYVHGCKEIECLRTLPSAQPEQHWIPVTERLPKTHKTGNSVSGIFMQSKPVLVYGVPEYEKDYSFHVVTYCDDLNGVTYWSTELDAVTINKVTAWMPLPAPYQEGAADERPED